MQPFSFNTPKSLVFEAGAAARLGTLLREAWATSTSGPQPDGPQPEGHRAGGHSADGHRADGRDVLFVTDRGVRGLGLCDAALADMARAGLRVSVFDAVEADPARSTVEAAAELGRAAGVSGVVGFGGGSSMDVAKLAALLLGCGQPLDAAWGVGQARGPRLPLALVPTTAGTGSEVTPLSIVTVENAEKRGVSSPLILPDLALLDPVLTLGLPGPVTAATGIDAMVHAIEAHASANVNNNPLSRMLAREALRLLGANIRTAVARPGDIEARGAMLLGAMLAGQAFANAPVAAVHALAYPIGGRFHVPHGVSNALVLPHVLRFNALRVPEAYAAIAADAFAELPVTGDAQARAAAFIAALAELSRDLGLPQRLRDVGIPRDALDAMAADAMLQTRLLVNNPRPLEKADARAIYEAAW